MKIVLEIDENISEKILSLKFSSTGHRQHTQCG